MTAIHREVKTEVVTHIHATEARLLDIDDVLIYQNEAYFVRDARFTKDGRVRVSLEGYHSLTLGKREPVLIVRVKINSAERPRR